MRRVKFLLIILILVAQTFALVESNRVGTVLASSKFIVVGNPKVEIVMKPEITNEARITPLTVSSSNMHYPSNIGEPTISVDDFIENATGAVAILVLPNIKVSAEISVLDDPLVGVIYDRFLRFIEERNVSDWGYSYVIPLIAEDASLENLVYLIYVFERHKIRYGIFGISHGYMNETDGRHGIVLYANNTAALVNGETIKFLLAEKYSFLLEKAVFVTDFIWVSCYIEDQYERYGPESFPGFFDKKAVTLPPGAPPGYDNKNYYFKIFGRGVTAIPQEAIDFLDRTLEEFSVHEVYAAAIVNGSTIVQGSMHFEVDFTLETLEISTETVLGPDLSMRATRRIKSYSIRISTWADTSPSAKIRGNRKFRETLQKMIKETHPSPRHETRTDILRELQAKVDNVEILDRIHEYFTKDATEVAKKIKSSYIEKSKLTSMLYRYYYTAKNKIKEALYWIIDTYGNWLINGFLKGIANGIIEATMLGVHALISFVEARISNVGYLVIKALMEGLACYKVVWLISIYAIMQGVYSLLSWLGKGAAWLLDVLASYMGIHGYIFRILRNIVVYGINYGAVVVGNALIVIRDELKRSLEKLNSDLGNLFKGFFEALSEAVGFLGYHFRNFLRFAYEMLSDPILTFMILNAITTSQLTDQGSSGDETSSVKRYLEWDKYDFIDALAILARQDSWSIGRLGDEEIKEILRAAYGLEGNEDKAFYMAKATFAIPLLAKWYLNMMQYAGVKGMYTVFLVTYSLVEIEVNGEKKTIWACLLYTSPSPRD